MKEYERKMLSLSEAHDTFKVPHGYLSVDTHGYFSPNVPLFEQDGYLYKSPIEIINEPDIEHSWKTITRGISYLTSNHTPFSHLGEGIKNAAVETYMATIKIKKRFPKTQILLPPSVWFSPGMAIPMTRQNGSFIFQSVLFAPPDLGNIEIIFDKQRKIEQKILRFKLHLKTEYKEYVHPIIASLLPKS